MLNRQLQRQILEVLRESYPQSDFIFNKIEMPEPVAAANLSYLQEHGLCESGLLHNIGGTFSWGEQRITARGLDFIEDDGGLGAILGVVTVRLHADTLRNMMIAKVEASSASPDEKKSLKQHLLSLPETALQAATTQLVAVGLTHLPDAIGWLRTLAGL